MVCKHCGAYMEQDKEICPVCRAPLYATNTPNNKQWQGQKPQFANNITNGDWGFVEAPRWPKPDFDIANVPDIPPPPTYTHASSTEQNIPPMGHNDNNAAYQRTGFAPAYNEARGADLNIRPELRQAINEREYNAPQDETTIEEYPTNNKPIASVGDYPLPQGGYNGGSFGRAPQYMDFEEQDTEEEYMSQKHGNRSFNKRGSRFRRQTSSMRKRSAASFRLKGSNVIFFGAAGVLILLLIVFSSIFINRKYGTMGSFFSSVFGGSPILKAPTITEGTNSQGTPIWRIVVYAKKGTLVTVRSAGTELSDEVDDTNTFSIVIDKNMLLPPGPVDTDTAEVIPEIYVTAKDGELIPVEMEPILVQVPPVELSLTNPAETMLAVSRSIVTFNGTVSSMGGYGDYQVLINGQSAAVAGDGTFSLDYDLGEPGSHTVYVEASRNGCKTVKMEYSIEYTQSAAAIVNVTKQSLRAPGDGDTATVTGTIDPGATLTLSGPSSVTLGTPNVNSETGEFSFTAKMSQVGHYIINASIVKDGRTSQGEINIEYAPNYQKYTASVHSIDYDRMVKEPQHTAAYKCSGNVIEILPEEAYVVAKLKTSKGDILFEYHNTAASVELNDGKTYNVFGDYQGIDEATGLPKIYAWFITKSN